MLVCGGCIIAVTDWLQSGCRERMCPRCLRDLGDLGRDLMNALVDDFLHRACLVLTTQDQGPEVSEPGWSFATVASKYPFTQDTLLEKDSCFAQDSPTRDAAAREMHQQGRVNAK